MAANSQAEKAPEVITRYEVCRLDGSDSRMYPDGTSLAEAKRGRDKLNREVTLGVTEPSAAHPNGQVLNSHVSKQPTPVRSAGMGGSGVHLPDSVIDIPGHGKHTIKGGELNRIAEYEIRTHLVEVR